MPAQNYIIKPSNTIKILGTHIRQDLQWDTEVGKLAANLHNKIYNIKKLNNYTDFRTRLSFINGFIIGKLNFMLPLYMNANLSNITKLHKVLMTAARVAIGNYCCKKSISQILGKCGWLSIRNMITLAVVKIIHKMRRTNVPTSICKMVRASTKNRKSKAIVPTYIPKQKQFLNFYMIKGLKIFNNMPNDICNKNFKGFKMAAKNGYGEW